MATPKSRQLPIEVVRALDALERAGDPTDEPTDYHDEVAELVMVYRRHLLERARR